MPLLAAELKDGTKVLHAEAGRSKFMKYFFKGEVSLATYGRFLVSLYQVYNALEQALDEHRENAQLALLYFPRELSRKAALEQDLEFFNGPQWREMIQTITPAQRAYIDAIQRCASSPTPELLAAHAYVRYLGDLSGGQVLAKRLQKFNDLPEDQGVAFYHFPLIEDNDMFKEMFRKRLNQIEVDDTLREQIIQEAKDTFLRNIDMFCEFDSELEGTSMTAEEQVENLVDLEREKAALRQGLQSNVSGANQEELTAMQTSFLANVWSSLSTAVGLKSTAS
ncbi:heme oxygenase (biliverdin-producing, ferredoxin) [Entomortierella parvispora]|uniref:Heme oxygenase (Biliverdin-producing, ferredoxin) n=1 Tax=Entomortierella parvispora TaxID=205924 RepID=A0A9P3LYG3_9FUNG|nr:heme oxygenase (biliverdin-producing, ferredoxin) [Entomortierella parvispora]